MERTTRLDLPLIMPSQAQKHVTHNEAIDSLDAIVHLSVSNRTTSTPPASPADGDRYLIASGPTGEWADHEGKIAAWQNGAWHYLLPQNGWRLWDIAESLLLVFDGTDWIEAASRQNLSFLGINATADTTNRLSVASEATLLNHDGAGHQLKFNKATATDTVSLLYQTGFSGRAEIGTTGDDALHIKISADGSAWTEAMVMSVSAVQTYVPVGLPVFTVSTLPVATTAGQLIYVSDASGSAIVAFSDGTDWRRCDTNTVVT